VNFYTEISSQKKACLQVPYPFVELRTLNLEREPLDLIATEFEGLYSGDLGLSSISGGQRAADAALESLDITGYANLRSEVLPRENRGASVLSPYIRHNLLTLDQVYRAVKDAPFRDKEKFRDELYWQEYARHLYARLGPRLFENLRFDANWSSQGDGWNREMRCIDEVVSELESDGWLVNQTRMWLASHWTVRNDKGWLHGQERMHRELIDGSRAANLLGWQWTVGAGTGKPYGFAKWQVDKRAPGICTKCPLRSNCPIENFPDEVSPRQLDRNPLLDSDPDPQRTAGPLEILRLRKADFVLLTIDSLGDADGALASNPDLPALFIFNKSALGKLQLSSRRIGFYLQTLQDLATRRELKVYLGDPYEFANTNEVAVTFAPVPSFRKFKKLAEVHPYPWLKTPQAGSVRSFTSWRQKIDKGYKKS
jgi:deoxyribodipyrimidine photo-lyase